MSETRGDGAYTVLLVVCVLALIVLIGYASKYGTVSVKGGDVLFPDNPAVGQLWYDAEGDATYMYADGRWQWVSDGDESKWYDRDAAVEVVDGPTGNIDMDVGPILVKAMSGGEELASLTDTDGDGFYDRMTLLHKGETFKTFRYDPESGWGEVSDGE